MGQDGELHSAQGVRPAALLAVRITPADLGKRVTIRYRLDDSLMTDVLGYLRSWSDETLIVERESGERVQVREPDLMAAKVIPARSPRARMPDNGGDHTS